jgi:hypothetical protein
VRKSRSIPKTDSEANGLLFTHRRGRSDTLNSQRLDISVRSEFGKLQAVLETDANFRDSLARSGVVAGKGCRSKIFLTAVQFAQLQ